MEQLTQRQARVLAMIENFQKDNGYPPTRVEIATHFGYKSSNAAEEYIKALVKKGFLQRVQGQSRGIKLTKRPEDSLPVINQTLARSQLLAQENINERLSVNGATFEPKADFLLEAGQDIPIGPGISKGDLIAIHQTECALQGEVILAREGNQLILERKLSIDASLSELSTNLPSGPIIEGKAVGVIRRSL